MAIERGPEHRENPHEDVRILCDSREEAAALVREFWRAMPHAQTLPADDDFNGWCSELTAGDRTHVTSGGFRNPGKWFASFRGNQQFLTREAEAWLREKMKEKK